MQGVLFIKIVPILVNDTQNNLFFLSTTFFGAPLRGGEIMLDINHHFAAAHAGNAKLVFDNIEKKTFSPFRRSTNGNTVGMIFAAAGDNDSLRKLLEINPDLLNQEDSFGASIFYWLIANKNFEFFLEVNITNPSIIDLNKLLVLTQRIYPGDAAMEELVEKIVMIRGLLRREDSFIYDLAEMFPAIMNNEFFVEFALSLKNSKLVGKLVKAGFKKPKNFNMLVNKQGIDKRSLPKAKLLATPKVKKRRTKKKKK